MELNQAAAIGEAGDTEAALALVERLSLDDYHYLHATRAELLRRLDKSTMRVPPTPARCSSSSDAERRFLEQRLAELPTDERDREEKELRMSRLINTTTMTVDAVTTSPSGSSRRAGTTKRPASSSSARREC